MSSTVDRSVHAEKADSVPTILPSFALSLVRVGLTLFVAIALGNLLGVWRARGLVDFLPDLCFFHRLTGFECPGCGMGRALLHLSHGDVGASIGWHPFAIPFLGFLILLAAFPRRFPVAHRRFASLASIALLSWWVLVKL